MQHGSSTKYHLLDFGYNYGELKWLAHNWSKRGQVSRKKSYAIKSYKRQFARAERRRGKKEVDHDYLVLQRRSNCAPQEKKTEEP
jgi:macrodomain Ter protein organizer (MatP/YcbG family)